MAEPLGLAMSGIALASLFSTCIEFIEYFEQGKNLAKDFQLALTKVSLMKRRLSLWGAAMSIESPGAESKILRDRWPVESGVVMESLMGIRDILVKTNWMCRRYLCNSKDLHQLEPDKWLEWTIDEGAYSERAISSATGPLPNEPDRHKSFKSIRLKALWAIQDRKRFQVLIADFDFLLGNLERIGERLQQDMTIRSISTCPSGELESRAALAELIILEGDSNSDPMTSSPVEAIFPSNTEMSSNDIQANCQNDAKSKVKELETTTTWRRTGEHLFCDIKATEDAAVYSGDYYEGGKTPNSAKGHIYAKQHAAGDSSIRAGNTDGNTALQIDQARLQARERRRAAEAQRGDSS